MKYVSDRKINEIIDYGKKINVLRSDIDTLEVLLDYCKELPGQQWQTIDEFKANPIEGWCWIKLIEGVGDNIELAYFNEDSCFYENAICMDELNVNYITHVMPIKTPEAPK